MLQTALLDAATRSELIRFGDHSYRIARTMMNGMLRTLNDYTLIKLIFLVWKSASDQSWRETANRYADEAERALNALPADGRKLVEKTTHDACRTTLDCATGTSMILCAIRIAIAMLHPIWNPNALNEHPVAITATAVIADITERRRAL